MLMVSLIQGLTILFVLFNFATQLLPTTMQYILQVLTRKTSLKTQAVTMVMTISFLAANLLAIELVFTTLYRHDFTMHPFYGFAAIVGAFGFYLISRFVFKMELKWFNQKMHAMKLV